MLLRLFDDHELNSVLKITFIGLSVSLQHEVADIQYRRPP